MTQEEAIQRISEMSGQIKALQARNESEVAKVAEVSDEIKALRQQLAESKPVDTGLGQAEAGLRKYLLTDSAAESIRRKGVNDAQGIESGALILKGYQDTASASYVPGILDDAPTCEWQASLQEAVTRRNLVQTILGKKVAAAKSNRAVSRVLDHAPAAIKRAAGFEAMQKAFVDGTGVGAEWIIDLGLPMVERDPRLAGELEGMLRVHDMATSTELLPFLTTGLRPYKHAAATGDDPAQFTLSSIATDQRTISASGMDIRTQLDEDAVEDAIIPATPFIQDELVIAASRGFEDCLVNGDTAATHQDTGIASWNIRSIWGGTGLGGAGDHRRTFIGLRGRAIDVANTTDMGATQTYAGMLAALATLDSPHAMSATFITSLEWMIVKMLAFSEFQGSEKVGIYNTLLSGKFAIVAGKKLVLSEFMDKQYNASGVYDNVTKTKTGLVTANLDRFWVTRRKNNVVAIDRDVTRGILNLVLRNRKGLFTPDSSTKKNVHWGYNLSPS